MTIPIGEITDADRLDIGKNAKCALERVCSGAGLDPPSRYYSPKFVDHVNNLKFYGLEGIRQSLELYTNVPSDIKIEVVDQLVEGNRVTSRFVIKGVNRGRQAHFGSAADTHHAKIPCEIRQACNPPTFAARFGGPSLWQ